MGFDKIIDFLLNIIGDLLPFFVVNVYEKSVVLRGGVTNRVKGPGLYWKWPFWEKPNTHMAVTTTVNTQPQTLLTKDGKAVTIKTVIKYNIKDIVKFVENIYDAEDALLDLTQGHNMREINSRNYDECLELDEISNEVSKKTRAEVKKYGIEIEQTTITNFIQTRNYRLFNES